MLSYSEIGKLCDIVPVVIRVFGMFCRLSWRLMSNVVLNDDQMWVRMKNVEVNLAIVHRLILKLLP